MNDYENTGTIAASHSKGGLISIGDLHDADPLFEAAFEATANGLMELGYCSETAFDEEQEVLYNLAYDHCTEKFFAVNVREA